MKVGQILAISGWLCTAHAWDRLPTNPAIIKRREFKSGLAGVLGVLVASSSSRAATGIKNDKKSVESRLSKLPECSDAVTLLRRGNMEVVLIGTAHISEQSVALVRRTMQTLQPDVAMIELDIKRIGSVKSVQELEDAGFILPNNTIIVREDSDSKKKPESLLNRILSSFEGLKEAAAGAVVGKALSSFYKSVENLGFETGGEFRAAIEEGRKYGAKILLGDRDVDITLQRLASAFQASDSKSIARLVDRVEALNEESGDVMDSISLDKEKMSVYVERIKQRKSLNSMLEVVRDEVPEIYAALIGERDAFMAQSIAGADARLLVAVIGIAHMNGIEKGLIDAGYKILKNNCPSDRE